MRLPQEFKLRDGQTKYLLKKVLARYLPAQHINRKKMGFGVPIAAWLRGPLRDWAQELIHDDALVDHASLDRSRLRALLQQHLSAEREAHPLLWSVLMLLCFVQKHDPRRASTQLSYREVA
jgi:asparagine synthase (glutamine-hydrolysing)